MFCNKCGAQVPEGSAFCNSCGAPVSAPGQAAVADKPKKKGAKGKIILWIAIILGALAAALCVLVIAGLLLGAVSLGAIGLFFGLSSTPTQEPEQIVEVLDPMEGNPYEAVYQAYEQYILPDSDGVYYCYEDIKNLTDEALWVALHEIAARHGAAFPEDAHLQTYFTQRQWYQMSAAEGELNDYERSNQMLLKVQHQKRKGLLDTEAYPDLKYEADYILPESGTRQIMEWELLGLNSISLNLARNEIMARHGYIFASENLQMYFYSKSWYKPTTQSKDFSFSCMNSAEGSNITLLQTYEKVSSKTGLSIPRVGVYDQYSISAGNSCFHIPGIDLSAAKSVNKKIYDAYYESIQESVYEEEFWLYNISYEAGRKDHILSVTVKTEYDWDYRTYDVYNVSVVTGKVLSDEEVYNAFGLTQEQGRERLISALEQWHERTDWFGRDEIVQEYPEYAAMVEELVDWTFSEENLSNARPFIHPSGKLCFAVEIGVPAGAGQYPYLLDQSGETYYITCDCN